MASNKKSVPKGSFVVRPTTGSYRGETSVPNTDKSLMWLVSDVLALYSGSAQN